MSDTLRTRIARVLSTYMFENSTTEELADAVIDELGLRREERDGRVVYDGLGQPINVIAPRCRYVTDWEADQ